jgi:hypothetical protein
MMLDDLPTKHVGVTKKSHCSMLHVARDELPASLPHSTCGLVPITVMLRA